ncbi:MAG: shikimate kinase [Clostridiales bacterium]|jgi:shikimate kinase|nr:shikimate kinase [Clostridiales bacterium]
MRRTSIALIGMMGCGKSVTGKAVAKLSGMGFIDTDLAIESSCGRSIPEIFASRGEEVFRRLEEEAVAQAASKTWTVIATGGGVPLRRRNQGALRRACIIFYLWASADCLYERTKDGGRPLLQVEDPKKRLAELLAARDPVYRSLCDKLVPCDDRTPEQTARQILSIFRTCPY